jgi:hypothetical protein
MACGRTEAGLEPQITGAGVADATAAFSYASQTNTESTSAILVELVGTMSDGAVPFRGFRSSGHEGFCMRCTEVPRSTQIPPDALGMGLGSRFAWQLILVRVDRAISSVSPSTLWAGWQTRCT